MLYDSNVIVDTKFVVKPEGRQHSEDLGLDGRANLRKAVW
jgi:hypothetical protein